MNKDEMRQVMEFIYTHKAPGLKTKDLAEVLDQLVWCLDDNGAALVNVREDWLVSNDRGRVELALSMGEVFPFREAQQMAVVLDQISAKWPELQDACSTLIEARAKAERGGQ